VVDLISEDEQWGGVRDKLNRLAAGLLGLLPKADPALGRVFVTNDLGGDIVPVVGITDPVTGSQQAPVYFDFSDDRLKVCGAKTLLESTSLPRVSASASTSGRAITVTGTIRRPSGNVAISGTITVDAAEAVAVTALAYTLKYSTDTRYYANVNAVLPYRRIKTVSVTEGGTPLVEGVGYSVFYEGGKLSGLVNTTDKSVLVNYTGLKQRYDYIVADALTGALSVVKGTDRAIDCEEYRPAIPDGTIALYSVFTYDQTVEVYPVHEWVGTQKRGRLIPELDAHNARILAPIRATVRKGGALCLIGYGDSLVAMAGLADHLVPNGTGRDLYSFFSGYEAGTVAAKLGSAVDFGDGGGAIHTTHSRDRQFKAYLESTYGCTIDYQNFGIGGSTSGTGISGSDRLNGLNPTRLNVVTAAVTTAIATKRVLVNLAFGMNELGSTATLANIIDLIQAFQAVGAVVQVIGIPRPNSYAGFGTYATWQQTNDWLYEAALEAGAAFVPTAPYFSDENLGYMGLSPKSLAKGQLPNHHGISEVTSLAQLQIAHFEGT